MQGNALWAVIHFAQCRSQRIVRTPSYELEKLSKIDLNQRELMFYKVQVGLDVNPPRCYTEPVAVSPSTLIPFVLLALQTSLLWVNVREPEAPSQLSA